MEGTLSNMESSEASAALTEAEATRAALAHGIATPSWFFTTIGAAIALQIGATAVGLGAGAMWVLIAGWAVLAAVAGVQLARFRRHNGVWLGGLASRVVFGTGTASSLSYLAALGGAIWAAYASRWWLVAVLSLAGGGAYALSGRRWMRTYRAAPAAHARGESAAWLAAIGVTAVAGIALLLING